MYTFIEWDKIEVKGTQSGVKNTLCPNCSHTRKKKKDTCLYVNFNSGVAKCFNCDALSFREDGEKQIANNYKTPPQIEIKVSSFNDKVLSYISSRKITLSTLEALYVSQEKYYQPALQKEVDNIVFNYYEGSTLINKKYRSADKKFTQTAGTKPIFYNINSIIGKKEAWIVEGEFDVLAMYEGGIKNCISVPNGANDNDDYWLNCEKYLKDIEKFYIATDNDEKGNELADKIAQRLGRYRCVRVVFKNKDANGDLIEGCLNESLESPKRYPVSGTFTVDELYDGMIDLYDNGLPETIYPKHHCFGALKDVFSVMRGHLITSTGIPSHGKSTFVEWYVLNLIKDYKMKASFFSPEHSPMKLHQAHFVQKTFAKNYFKAYPGTPRVSREDLKRYKSWANEKIYLTSVNNGEFPTWDWLFDKFKEQMFTFGIDIFVIDAFNKLQLPNGNKLDEINKVLTKLTMFAQMNNVIIFLVAHPTKMKKNEQGTYSCPTLYDVSGSSDFRNQTHDGFAVYRNWETENEGGFTEFVNLKTKFSFQGEIGKKVEFDYHLPSGRYYERGTEPPTHDLTIDFEEEVKPLIYVDEDCPF
jgi:twinkle protein